MTKPTLQRIPVMIAMAGLVLAFSITTAFAWDMAAHAYIEEHLYKKSGQMNETVLLNRIYGASTMDLFNNSFDSPYLDFANYLHDPTQENFLKVWSIADGKEEKAFAYGFVGHNNSWGMDSTAHVSGRTFGKREGYVIAKARILSAALGPKLEPLLGALDQEVLVNLCHYLIESGVDFLVLSKDPTIGYKLMAAADYRSTKIPDLLANAYKEGFAPLTGGIESAAVVIKGAEDYFNASMKAYGGALTQDNGLELVAEGLAAVGVVYLGLDDSWIPDLTSIAAVGILAAMELCAPDFERELQATTGWINGKLSLKKIVWQ